jgi:ATP-binding cassette subfamily B (MDR/TAP) protein 1
VTALLLARDRPPTDTLAVGAERPEDVTQAALDEACEQACILQYIRGLPDGFDTDIGIKGAALSGGQRQVRPCAGRSVTMHS